MMKRLIAVAFPFLFWSVCCWGDSFINSYMYSSDEGGCSSNLLGDVGNTPTATSFTNETTFFMYTRIVAGATGYANQIVARCQYADGEDELIYAVYDEGGNLIDQTSTGTGTAANEDIVLPLSEGNICIESGSTYYIAIDANPSASINYFFRGSDMGNNIWKVTRTYGSGFPSSISPSTDSIEIADSTFNARLRHN